MNRDEVDPPRSARNGPGCRAEGEPSAGPWPRRSIRRVLYTREGLAIDVERHLTSEDVLERLTDLFVVRGTPAFIRSDNGPEFTAGVVRAWLARLRVRTLFMEPGSPWENGFIESFNGTFPDELLHGEIFTTLQEAKVLVEQWRRHYNTKRPHSSLGRRPPAPETILPRPPGFAPLRQVAAMGGLTYKLVPERGAGQAR